MPPPRFRRLSLSIALLAVFLLGIGAGSGELSLPGLHIPNSSQPDRLDPSPLWRIWNEIERSYDGQVKSDRLLEGAAEGLVESLGDPYSEFLSAAETKQFNRELSGQVEGIGAEVGIRGSALTIIAPLDSSPAQQAGLRSGDVILQIGDERTAGLSVSEAVSRIRGPAGTTVSLTLRRDTREFKLSIKRALITAPSVLTRQEGGYPYIKIARFDKSTATDFDRALEKTLRGSPKALILDLRGNPGGYLDTSLEIAGEFLPEGAIILRERTKGRSEKLRKASSSGRDKKGGPRLILLVDSGSASASEILAGALRDHGRAILIGETTFGKGSVQSLEPLPGGTSLRLTIAHWYTPNGQGFHGKGLKPDISTPKDVDPLQRALEFLQDPK